MYPDYEDEPLVKLLRSEYFKGLTSQNLMGLSLIKIQIFLILSTKADFRRKMECFMPLLADEENVKRDKALEVIETVFQMCTLDLL